MAGKVINYTIHSLLDNFRMGYDQELILEYQFLNQNIDPSSVIERMKEFLVFAEQHFPILATLKKSNELSKKSRSIGNDNWIRFKDNEIALLFYNAAIGQAENSSAELSLAYASRSALNFELGRFKDVITDIDRALAGGYPQHLKFKLFERKAKCFEQLKNYSAATSAYKEAIESLDLLESDAKKLKLKKDIKRSMATIKNKTDIAEKDDGVLILTHKPSDTIYCASEAVKVDSSPSLGRMIVATRAIKPGDLLAVEKAYASGLHVSYYHSFCYDCKKSCHSMIPCLECTKVFYCDEICRSRSWQNEHMIECEMMPTINSLCRDHDVSYSIALKMLLKMTKQGRKLQNFIDKQQKYRASTSPFRGFKNNQFSANNTSMMNIYFHDELSDGELGILTLQSCLLVLALKKTTFFDYVTKGIEMDVTVGQLLSKMILRSKTNIMSMGPEEEKNGRIYSSSGAVLPFISLINHSCDPNCQVVECQGDTFFLIAAEPILKGQQICISYGPEAAEKPKIERHLFLQHWTFTCNCQACAEDWPILEELTKVDPFVECDDPLILERKMTLYLSDLYLTKNETYETEVLQAMFDSLIDLLIFFHKNSKKPNSLALKCKLVFSSIIFALAETNSLMFK